MKKRISVALTAIFIAVLIYFLAKIDYDSVGEALSSANITYLLISLGLFIFTYFSKSLRIQLMTKYYKKKVPFRTAFAIDVVSITLATFTPGRVGEFSKVLLFKKKGLSTAQGLAIAVIERLFDLMIIAIVILTFFANFISQLDITNSLYVVFGLLAFAILALFNLDKFEPITPKRFKKHLVETKLDYRRKEIYPVIVLSAMNWLIDGYAFYLITRAFDISVPFIDIFGVYCVIVILSVLSILPNGLGSLDVSAFFLFNLIGVQSEVTVALLLVFRVAGFLLPITVLIASLPFNEFNILKIKKQIEKKVEE